MRWILSLLLLVPALAWADPPKIDPPSAQTVVGDLFSGDVILSVKAAPGKKVGQLKLFADADVGFLRLYSDDPETLVFQVRPRKPGKYQVAYWTVGEATGAAFILEAKSPAAPQPPPPPTKEPDAKPDPKAPVPTGSLYFMLIRGEGPADPAFTRAISDPAWATLKAKGHQVKDFDVKGAARLGLSLPAGTRLPCVVVLRTNGQASEVVRGPMPIPATSQGILELEKGP